MDRSRRGTRPGGSTAFGRWLRTPCGVLVWRCAERVGDVTARDAVDRDVSALPRQVEDAEALALAGSILPPPVSRRSSQGTTSRMVHATTKCGLCLGSAPVRRSPTGVEAVQAPEGCDRHRAPGRVIGCTSVPERAQDMWCVHMCGGVSANDSSETRTHGGGDSRRHLARA